MDLSGDPILVECPECSGVGSRVRPCPCTQQRARPGLLRGLFSKGATPDPRCSDCSGSGTKAHECSKCAGDGQIRGQLVLTVVNLDSGAVASVQVVAGAVEPVRFGLTRLWCVELQPLVDELAARTGGVCAEKPSAGHVVFPEEYSPDMPDEERSRLEAVAMVTGGLGRHRIFIARAEQPEPVPRPDVVLGTLCRLATRLCLDLVVWRYPRQPGRVPGWWIGLQPAGAGLPSGEPFGGADLGDVLLRLKTHRLLFGAGSLGSRDDNRAVPGHFIAPNAEASAVADEAIGTVDELAANLDKRPRDAGMIAIWRDGAWHYSPVARTGIRREPSLRTSRPARMMEVPTWGIQEPSPPSYWAEKIPTKSCPGCQTGEAWTVCVCALDTGIADVDCSRCAGSGQRQTPTCGRCGETGKLHEGVVITVTDLDNYARHINLAPTADVEVAKAGQQPRNPELANWQLPESYRLTTHFFDDGIDLANTTSEINSPVSSDLVNATVLAPSAATPPEVVTSWCEKTAKSKNAARAFVIVSLPRREKLSVLANIATGLGLEVVAACQFRSLALAEGIAANAGTRWGVKILTPGEVVKFPNSLTSMDRTLSSAVGHRFDHLVSWYQQGHQPAPAELCRISNQPPAANTDADHLETTLSRLATEHDFDTISARISSNEVTITRHFSGAARHAMPEPDLTLAHAPTIAQVLTQLNQ